MLYHVGIAQDPEPIKSPSQEGEALLSILINCSSVVIASGVFDHLAGQLAISY
jgi:hypothetical protein